MGPRFSTCAAMACLLFAPRLWAEDAHADPAQVSELIIQCANLDQAVNWLEKAPDGLPPHCRLEAALPCLDRAPESLRRMVRVVLPSGESMERVRRVLAPLAPSWMETAPVRHTDLLPDDNRFDDLWALPLIQAPQAWDLHQGQGEVLLAVVDTGVELQHADLAESLWQNPGEGPSPNGLDDDGNGLVDDLHGADLLDNDGDPSALAGDLSHGTHTAGTAACVTDNGEGVACAAWRVALMPVRAGHQGTISRGVEGLWYAAAQGARVISCSWGGDSWSNYEHEVVQAARELGALVVASAGNNGTEMPHYPAAYPGVLAVAATTPQDTRMPGSQVGWWVDCAAPGQDILSTVMGNGYALKSGTSMATPLVASLAALAFSQHPLESGDQVRERVKAACVSIDAQNPGLVGKLGSGRVSALNLMNQEPRAVQETGLVLVDADGDGIAEPGETLQLRLGVQALLGSFSALSALCTVPGGEAQVQDGSISYGSLDQGQSALPADAFVIALSTDLEPGSQIRLQVTFTASPSFSQRVELLIPVAPTFADHDNGNLQLSLGSHGVQGYWDFEANEGVGNGLRWPQGSASHLYTGSLLLESGDQVAHAVSYLGGQPSELEAYPGGEIRRWEDAQGLHSEAEFGAEGLPGLRVRQRGLSRAGEDWLLLRFELRNAGGQVLSGLRPGLWLDLDVGGSWGNDTGGWSASSGTGWQTQSGGPVAGLRLVSEAAESFRLCRWSEWSGGAGLEDDELAQWLASGFQQVQAGTPDDWQILLGASAMDLPPGAVREVAVVLAAGGSVAEVESAADEGEGAWQEVAVDETSWPGPFGLDLRAWPNPFNPVLQWSVQLQSAGTLRWYVMDLLGRQVDGAVRRGLPSGLHQERLDLTGKPSGLYLLAVEQGGRREVARLLLLR